MCKTQCPRCKNESLIESIKKREEKYAELINIITSYAIENVMSLEEIDECIEHLREVYYSDGVIRKYERTAQEVPVQEQPKFKIEYSNDKLTFMRPY